MGKRTLCKPFFGRLRRMEARIRSLEAYRCRCERLDKRASARRDSELEREEVLNDLRSKGVPIPPANFTTSDAWHAYGRYVDSAAEQAASALKFAQQMRLRLEAMEVQIACEPPPAKRKANPISALWASLPIWLRQWLIAMTAAYLALALVFVLLWEICHVA